jgi:hypothetical protein
MGSPQLLSTLVSSERRAFRKESGMRRWLLAGVVLLVVGIGVAGAIWGDGDWGPDRGEVVTRSIAADGTETIVVHEDHRGFFPFGIFLFPLFIFGLVIFFRAIAFRGAWGRNGPWMPGGPPAGNAPGWFDEWHRRAHSGEAPPMDDQTS